MKILTVRNPWAWLIIHGGKDVENRSTNIAGSYRGPIAIHASLRDNQDSWNLFLSSRPDRAFLKSEIEKTAVYGSIIGVVDLVDVHNSHDDVAEGFSSDPGPTCSEWAMPTERFHLVLNNPRAINPIPYRGFLGLRDIVEEDILMCIKKQLLASN